MKGRGKETMVTTTAVIIIIINYLIPYSND